MNELTMLAVLLAYLAALETIKVVVSIVALFRPDAATFSQLSQAKGQLPEPLATVPCYGLEGGKVEFFPPSGRPDVVDLNGESGLEVVRGREMMAAFYDRQEWRQK